MTPLLQIKDLVVEFTTERGTIRAVDGVSLDIAPGQTIGVVGESGCGKSVTALSILRLLAKPAGRIASGEILFRGENIVTMPERSLRLLRGNRIAMIFQEPMTALNPVFTVGDQICEVITLHQHKSKREAKELAIAELANVGIPAPAERFYDYPHQLSGGMRQRVMIAMALACKPDLLIADEPTTALDVTIQAQILELLASLQQKSGMSMLLITHDLGVVARVCQQVYVMYAGKVVESSTTKELFTHPNHHYTAGLLRSMPGAQHGAARDESGRRIRLAEIPGMVPSLYALPPGCAFAARCSGVQDKCKSSMPALTFDADRGSRCWYPLANQASLANGEQ